MLNRFVAVVITCVFSFACYGLDLGNESTADKADRFKFEEFHKEKGVTLWDDKKGEEKKDKKEKSAAEVPPASAGVDGKVFEKGQTLKIREAYKLGNDPSLRNVQSLFDATEALHKQLNDHCPNGWAKEREWHKPEAGRFYIYYQASCL